MKKKTDYEEVAANALKAIGHKYQVAENRQAHNRELVRILEDLVESNPYLRFGQILSNYGFVKDTSTESAHYWEDDFMTESQAIHERVKKECQRVYDALCAACREGEDE